MSKFYLVAISAIVMVLMISGAYYGNRHKFIPFPISTILVGFGTFIFGFSLVFFVISKNDIGASLFTGIMLGLMNMFWFLVVSKARLSP